MRSDYYEKQNNVLKLLGVALIEVSKQMEWEKKSGSPCPLEFLYFR